MVRRRRKGALILLVLIVLLLSWLVYGMISDLRSRPVSYRVQTIRPVNSWLCTGDVLRYEVEVEVRDVPVVLSIVEAWCQSGTSGICAQSLTREYKLPILAPRYVYTIASRPVPESTWFQPNREYEFWHATTNDGNTTGYVVKPIFIRDNCDTPEGGPGGN